ncbi:MAG: mannose-1-phosphate guanylyltransferase [Phycisphaerae bacterium]|nr:mannose-1-phosphate guanylyltransferase [Phycisphaerae bacterium]
MRHAVIMAGGAGTRLWPLSRKRRPKQLLRLFDGASLLQIARRRLAGLFSPENIWVITSAHYLAQVAEELPDLPRSNLIGEPMGRDTANAIGLAAQMLARRDPDATMAVFTADHIIQPQDRFAAAICTGLDAAEQHVDSLITFGITPTSPHTGYGYLHRGERLGSQTYRVAQFKEKPCREVAERYLRSGEYYWNSGMFVWRVSAVLAELERLLPENAGALADLAANWERLAGTDEGARRFEQLYKTSIDFGVMEKALGVLLVEMNCDWMDLGSWLSIASTQEPDDEGNVTIAPQALVVDTQNNILVTESDHLLVALGVSDLVVVHSDDATLVCRRDQVERIKDLAKLREARFGDRFE